MVYCTVLYWIFYRTPLSPFWEGNFFFSFSPFWLSEYLGAGLRGPYKDNISSGQICRAPDWPMGRVWTGPGPAHKSFESTPVLCDRVHYIFPQSNPRPTLLTHICYWGWSPVWLDWPRYPSNFPPMASHHVSHNFIHLSPGPTVLDCIYHFKPTQVHLMCHGL